MSVPPINTKRLQLVSLSPTFIDALLEGRCAEAEEAGQISLADAWPDEPDIRFLRMRLEQMRAAPAAQEWLVRAMVLPPSREMIGHIGFHGPPEVIGRAELGYAVFPSHRRSGYAVEAVLGMMDWAHREHGVERFFVSISPKNAASLAMAAKLGFSLIGEQMDEEDGLEYVFELAVS